MKKFYILSVAGILIFFSTGCKKFELVTKTVYSPSEISNITYNSATISTGIIEVGENLKSYGHCYGTESLPTVSNSKTINTGSNAKKGDFSEEITGLNPNTTYYLRAYFEADSIKYGNLITLELVTPTVITDNVNIYYITATCGGNVTDEGSFAITERGVCWSTNQNPTTQGNHITDVGTGTGLYTNNIIGLSQNTTYYVRAYAINSVGISYGDEKTFTTLTAPSTVTDYDGNTYNTVIIGNQLWMKENLKVTRYHDGTGIPLIEDNTVWENLDDNNTDDAYCYYNNNSGGEADTYGALYTWAAAMGDNAVSSNTNPSGVQGVCPDDWHLPSDAEWTELTDYLGGSSVAGGKMKETGTDHWDSPNTGATNESGFTALPGGYRRCNDGNFYSLGIHGIFWSATEYTEFGGTCTHSRILPYNHSNVSHSLDNKGYGFSVRCLRD
ncbi:MAG: fibrobacter succinogenes major paralogous domain-containing protein [Bacteroidales bacterium]|nr:fibrobacter succinogenes major paralogous domain-containing protein [Bacteroidales bacterium]